MSLTPLHGAAPEHPTESCCDCGTLTVAPPPKLIGNVRDAVSSGYAMLLGTRGAPVALFH